MTGRSALRMRLREVRKVKLDNQSSSANTPAQRALQARAVQDFALWPASTITSTAQGDKGRRRVIGPALAVWSTPFRSSLGQGQETCRRRYKTEIPLFGL